MEINEVIQQKVRLEQSIFHMINTFHNETKCTVTDIRLFYVKEEQGLCVLGNVQVIAEIGL